MSIRNEFAAAAISHVQPVEHHFVIEKITRATNPEWLGDFAAREDIAPFSGISIPEKIESIYRRSEQNGCVILGLFDHKNPGPVYATLQTQEGAGTPDSLDKVIAGDGFPSSGFGDTMVFFSIQRWRSMPKSLVAVQNGARVSGADMLLDGAVGEIIANAPNIKREVTLSPLYGFRSKLGEFIGTEEPARDLPLHTGISHLKNLLEEGLQDRQSFERVVADNHHFAHDVRVLALHHALTMKEGRHGFESSCAAAKYHWERGAMVCGVNVLGSSTDFARDQSAWVTLNHYYPREAEVRQSNIKSYKDGKPAVAMHLQGLLSESHARIMPIAPVF